MLLEFVLHALPNRRALHRVYVDDRDTEMKYVLSFLYICKRSQCWYYFNDLMNTAKEFFSILLTTYLLLFNNSSIVSFRICIFSNLKLALLANPFATALSILLNWSPNIGIPIIGTPERIASVVDNKPPCDMNKTQLGWAERNKRKKYKEELIEDCHTGNR